MLYNPTEKLLLISELVESNSTYSSHYNLNDMIDLNYKYEYFTLYNHCIDNHLIEEVDI